MRRMLITIDAIYANCYLRGHFMFSWLIVLLFINISNWWVWILSEFTRYNWQWENAFKVSGWTFFDKIRVCYEKGNFGMLFSSNFSLLDYVAFIEKPIRMSNWFTIFGVSVTPDHIIDVVYYFMHFYRIRSGCFVLLFGSTNTKKSLHPKSFS